MEYRFCILCLSRTRVCFSDLFPAPDGESQDAKLGNEGRQLRSRLVEACNLCGKPLASAAGKSSASHIHCTCVTPPGSSTTPNFTGSTSPRKKKIELEVGESSKRQLFKDTSGSTAAPKLEIVEDEVGECSTSSATAEKLVKVEIKSEDENAPKKSRHACSICSKCFNTPGKLNQHMFSHTGEKPFVCSHCSKAFSSKFKLVRHILIHSDLRQYRCTVCDRTFHRKDHLKNHSKVHSPVKRRFKCDRSDCNKEYSSILSYRKHMAVHSAQEGNLECKICGKKCETKEDTLNHLKIHAGSRSLKTPADRKYRCDQCDRSFFTGKDVRRHLVVHTGRRDFLCQYCPQRFGRKDHLTRHIKKSHSSSAKKVKTKRTVDPEKSKSVGNILQEMFEKKVAAEAVASSSQQQLADEQPSLSQSVSDDLYKMQGLDSPVDVTKLESSPDIVPLGAMDDKGVLPTKVEDNLGLYGMPMIDTNIPFNKYEQYQFGTFPGYSQQAHAGMPGPSTSTMIPDLMGYEQPPPPYPADLTATFDPENVQVKTEAEYVTHADESSTLDLVLPPITNIPPPMSSCMLSNADLQTLLSSSGSLSGTPATDEDGNNDNGDRNMTDQLLNLLPNSTELLASLLASPDPQTNSAPLPGFNQAFHQPP